MPRAFLLDLDGTLYTGGAPIPGVPAALAELRRRGVPCRFLTNTTSLARRGLIDRLRGFGYEVADSELITPIGAATALLRADGIRTVIPFVPEAALEDLSGFELVGGMAPVAGRAVVPVSPVLPVSSAVLIGDLGTGWTFDLMQAAFAALMSGCRFLALSRDRYFQSAHGLRLDAGTFVAALEYASGRAAELLGKPGLPYYQKAIESLGGSFDRNDIAMVGDDLWSDIDGAQRAGCQGWLVRTGKFRDETLRQSAIVPDRIIASAAELPEVAG